MKSKLQCTINMVYIQLFDAGECREVADNDHQPELGNHGTMHHHA
jgi:hypothetical protein